MQPWYKLSVEEAASRLDTDLKKGLSSREAGERLEKYGPNKLSEGRGRGPAEMFLDQFKDVLIIILIISALISALLGEVTDSIVIAIILVLNAVLGVIQEFKAEKSLAALKEMAAPQAVVLRDGRRTEIPAREIVPGDIVLLEAGDYVPADLRLTSVTDLKIEESVLTGESVPVEKLASKLEKEKAPIGDRRNMAFMGTVATYGRGKGIVTATGMNTEMGQIAEMLEGDRREPTPLQKRLDKMGKKLGLITLIIVTIVVIAGLLRGIEFFDIFMTGISLAVAAVPEGLPAVVTIVLALGVQRMIKRHAIIRRLPAVETLGATTVICSDKTGTLTQNQMTVKAIYLPGKEVRVEGEGYTPEGEFFCGQQKLDVANCKDLVRVLRAAALCNNADLKQDTSTGAWDIIGDPTEGALVVAAAKAGLTGEGIVEKYPRLQELPFDSTRKRMSTIHRTPNGEKIAFVKGAPDVILELCSSYQKDGRVYALDDEMKEKISDANQEFAIKALRVLAVACKPLTEDKETYDLSEVERDLTFLGLMGMIDPPRREVAEAVKICENAGIRPIMITGDYPVTAMAIAKELGIYKAGDRALKGFQLEDMSQEELERVVLDTTVFARVSPRHKSRIVKALQKKGQIVAMTGDGVNDAPALKDANIGVAMGITGTDVSKQAADMVLTDDNFASIVAAVEEGRAIYENIKKFIRFLLSCNIGEILTLFIAIVAGLPRPLIPIQILWVNLVTDGFPALALGVDPAGEDLMKRPPRDPEEGIFSGKMGFNIASQGVYVGLITLFSFYLGLQFYSLPAAQTMAFGTLALSQLFQAFNSRSERYSLLRIGPFTNRYLLLAAGVSGTLQLGVMLIPVLQEIFGVVHLNLTQWGIVLVLSFTPILFVEVLKLLGLTYEK